MIGVSSWGLVLNSGALRGTCILACAFSTDAGPLTAHISPRFDSLSIRCSAFALSGALRAFKRADGKSISSRAIGSPKAVKHNVGPGPVPRRIELSRFPRSPAARRPHTQQNTGPLRSSIIGSPWLSHALPFRAAWPSGRCVMRARVSIIVLASVLAVAAPVLASDVGYIYGRIETVDGDQYLGQLRWGDEESFWDDLFNADKAENENLALMDPATLERVRSRHWGSWVFFGAGIHDPSLTHSLAVRFGDLRRLEIQSGNDVIAEFRNGDQLPLHGGSNDIGAEITVADPKFGTRQVRWSRIRSIEFMDTP